MTEKSTPEPKKDKRNQPVIRHKKGHVMYLLVYLALFYFGVEGLATGHTDIIVPGLSDPEDAEKQAVMLSMFFLVLSIYGISYCAKDLYTAVKKGE